MGLFDSIAGEAAGAFASLAGNAHPGLMGEVAALVGGANSGGLQGLVSAFEQNGMGAQVASWVGSGHNLPITAEQLQSVLGSEQVEAIAQRLGLPADAAAKALAEVLPHAVDHLTPAGTVPDGNMIEEGLAMFKNLSGR